MLVVFCPHCGRQDNLRQDDKRADLFLCDNCQRSFYLSYIDQGDDEPDDTPLFIELTAEAVEQLKTMKLRSDKGVSP